MSRSSLYPPSVDPGFPSLGKLPSGWIRTTFANALEKVERPVDLEPQQLYRLVTAKRSRGGIVLRSELPGNEILTKTQFVTRAGDFLISRRQIIHGACGLVPKDLDGAVISNEYSALRTRPGLLMDYLRHYCHTPYFQRTCFHSSHGVDVEKMIFKIDEWLAREVDLPPLPEQRKIAAILSSVDEAIEGTQAVIDQLQVVKKAMMADLLTRGIPGRHKTFKQTEIGEVPAEWDVVSVGSLFETCSGGTPARDVAGYWGGNIPWVKTGEVDYREITKTEESISPLALDNSAAKLLPSGTLLMAMYGQGATRGRVALLAIEAACNQACLAFLPGPRMTTRFLFHVFSSKYEELRSLGHEGTQKNLNAALVREVVIPSPSIDEQTAIGAVMENVDSRLKMETAQLQALLEVKSALMSVLLTGEVRVKVDEGPAA